MAFNEQYAFGGPRPWLTVSIVYGLYVLVVTILCLTSLNSMAKTWLTSSAYGHGILIAPISIGLIFWQRREVMYLTPAFWPKALLALGPAALFWAFGRYIDAQIIEHVGVTTLLIVGVLLFYGPQISRKWAFPLIFAFFMIPAGESLIPVLQTITAIAVSSVLPIAGLSASVTELLITTDAGRFYIAEGCSGLRFLLAAIITGSLFGYYAFTDWRQRVVFLAAAAGIALLANVLRVVAVIVVASVTGSDAPLVTDHLLLGWLFYVLAIITLMALGLRYRTFSEIQ